VKSNREAKGEMSGNVLDFAMVREAAAKLASSAGPSLPVIVGDRIYEPGEYPDPDAPRSEPGLFDRAFVPGQREHPATEAADAPEWPWARVALVAGTDCNEAAFSFDGTRYVIAYPKDSTAVEIARAIAAKVPGATVQGETVIMPPTTWSGPRSHSDVIDDIKHACEREIVNGPHRMA
jgi:hypothetical protein